MISKNQIDYVASWELKSERACHPSHRTAVIQLSLLRELRQQLKKELCRTSELPPCRHCVMIDTILGVEGEQK